MSISNYPAGWKGANYNHGYPHDPCANYGQGHIHPVAIRPGPPNNGYPHVNPNYANNGYGPVRPETILPGGPPQNGYPNNPNYANNGRHGPIHSENVVIDPANYAHTDNAYLISQKIKWKETEKEHIFKVELPGVKKKDVTVDMEDNRYIKIAGETWVDNTDPRRRTERTRVKVSKSFRLPDDSKPLLTEASMENGVLTVRVPRLDIRTRTNFPSVRIPVL